MSGLKKHDTFTWWNTMQQKERKSPTICSSMDGSREHYAKWNKPGGEREIPYDLTYKWKNFLYHSSKFAHWKDQTNGHTYLVKECAGQMK